jgi:DNA recombination protein RmuC
VSAVSMKFPPASRKRSSIRCDSSTGVFEPIVTMVWHTAFDLRQWPRYSRAIGLSPLRRLLLWPVLLGLSVTAHVAEMAGMLDKCDFHEQVSVDAEEGRRKPDMVVNLPGAKQMAVDAKVPYTSFMDAHRDGLAPEERHSLLLDHAKQVRRHVDALASKSYWSGLEASPEFTVAFIPNDQLLAAALEADPSLMEYAFGKGIVLATPTNLWAILKTVAFTWRQENLTEDAKQVFDLGTELYRRICKLSEHAEKLRRSLEGTVKSYNAFASSLESRVLVTARKLDQMDESSLLAQATEIETVPKALTSSDFEVIADLDRAELDLGLETVEAEIVEDDRKSG